jgi:hypothetical protein
VQQTLFLQKPSNKCKSRIKKIHDATHPLCGFGGKQIVAHGKITMPITFGYVHNTRTEQVVFDIIDMDYPYNAIIRRGTLNAFEAILHTTYLCMKILLGRRRRRHPSLDAFARIVGPTETSQRTGSPFVSYVIGRRPATRSSHLATSSSMEAHV